MPKPTKYGHGKAVEEDHYNDGFIEGAQIVVQETVEDGTQVKGCGHDNVKDGVDSEVKRDGDDPGNGPVLAAEAPHLNEGASNTQRATATPEEISQAPSPTNLKADTQRIGESRYWLRHKIDNVSPPDNLRMEKSKYWLRPTSSSSFTSTALIPDPQRGFEDSPEIMTANEVRIKAHKEDEDHRGAAVGIDKNNKINLERIKKGVNDDSENGLEESMAEAPSTHNQHTLGTSDKEEIIEKEDVEDLFSLLPKEVLLDLFEFLNPGDLLKVSQTSKHLRILAEDDLMWEKRCERAGLANCLTRLNLKALERRNENGSFVYSKWKASFLKPYMIEKNFRLKEPRVIRVENGSKATSSPMKLCNNKIVYHFSQTLYVSCAAGGKLLFTLVGHTGMIRAFEMDKQVVISGSDDSTLKVWNVDNGECQHTLVGHTDSVLCVQLRGGLVVSGSSDTTLRVWDVQEGRCLHTLVGHQTLVHRLQYDGRLVVSGDYSSSVKVWDPTTGDCLRTLITGPRLPFAFLTDLKFDGAHVAAVIMTNLATNLVKVWEVDTGILKYTRRGPGYGISGMEVRNDVLVCLQPNNFTPVKIREFHTGSILHSLDRQHSGAITGIQINEKFVVTSSIDGTVKLWDVKTGEFIKNLFSGDKDWKWEVRQIVMEDAKIVCLCVSERWIHEMDKVQLLVLNLDFDEE